MDQSRSNNEVSAPTQSTPPRAELPKRTFTLEFLVGIFMMVGVAAVGYLSVGLGGLDIMSSTRYSVIAQFDNISGLKYGASVEIAGVPIGEVSNISLKDPIALVTLQITQDDRLKDDDLASISTKGII